MLNESTLQRFEQALKTFSDVATKDDFTKFAESVLKLILQIEKRTSEAIDFLQKEHARILNEHKEYSDKSHTELKGKVNDLFVGEQLNRIKSEHQQRMSEVSKKLSLVKDGRTPTKEELRSIILPLIPEPIPGRPGKSENLSEIYKRLDELKDELEKEKKKSKFIVGGGTASTRGLLKALDISSSLNGVTTTFNIQAVYRVIDVKLSSKPVLRETTDWTWTPTSVSFTSEINPSTDLAAGQSCILIIAEA